MNDLICNHVGNEQLLDVLPWSKTSQYTQQPRHAWESGVDPNLKVNYAPGRPDGYIKQFENLSFLKIIEAGHSTSSSYVGTIMILFYSRLIA